MKRVRVLASGRELAFRTRCAIIDQFFNPDPLGEVTIEIPEEEVDSLATVLVVEM